MDDPSVKETLQSYGFSGSTFMTAGQRYAARREAKRLAQAEAREEERKQERYGDGRPKIKHVVLDSSEIYDSANRDDITPRWTSAINNRRVPDIVTTNQMDSNLGAENNRSVMGTVDENVKPKPPSAVSPPLFNRPFRPPVLAEPDESTSTDSSTTTTNQHTLASSSGQSRSGGSGRPARSLAGKLVNHLKKETAETEETKPPKDERLKMFDDHLLELIESEIISVVNTTSWDNIAGLVKAKQALREVVVWPFQRPDLFHGLRAPAKGVLLFGPPGTGKTMIGRCVASECGATFFNISASSITSKWIGEGEKLVRALFAVARTRLPAIIFIDEIDSILSSRSDSEHESSRRIKTEFLVQLDGVATQADERLLVLAATNRPHELDEAARRRFTKRLYIPLPDADARVHILSNLLQPHKHNIDDQTFTHIGRMTDGYSGADMQCLSQETAYGPLRSLGNRLADITADEIRPIDMSDFTAALKLVRPSVAQDDLQIYETWNKQFGTLVVAEDE